MAKEKPNEFMVCQDHQRRTCIRVSKSGDQVKFIPLDIANGFEVHQTSVASFEQRFKPLPSYPVDRACQLYYSYCQAVGATFEVLNYLGRYVTVSETDREAITTKRQGLTTSDTPPWEDAPTKKQSTKRAAKSKKQAVNGYTSAAKMFQALIMAGDLTDDEIFNQVQTAFGLEDKKRSYVKWYRNQLIKQGQQPPAAKEV